MNHSLRGILVTLFTLSFVVSVIANPGAPNQSPPVRETINKGKTKTVSFEEQTVRALYEKVTKLNRATLVARNNAEPNEDQVLRFELSDFKVGPIAEILSRRADDVMTGRTGPFIQLGRQISQLNGGPEHVGYEAVWSDGEYASIYEPEWTMNDLLNVQADQNGDLQRYTTFQVRLRFQGKQRNYQAIALFPDRRDDNGKPKFWDLVVGRGGVLNDVWSEKRPLVTEMKSSQEVEVYQGAADGVALLFPMTLPGTTWGTITRPTVSDRAEHTTGQHGQTVGFQGACTESNTQQTCEVFITDTFTFENGTVTSLFAHVNRADEKRETSTGPLGTEVKCSSARGVATSSCIFGICGSEFGLVGTAGSWKMTGGNIWNGQLVRSHSCKSGFSSAGQTCTTPSFDGTCPIGSSPSSSGLCCYSPTSSCSLTFASRCLRFGGDYDFETCSCFGCDSCSGSPIVVDIKGDGIILTNAANGVEFDLNGNGTLDHLGWTTQNSDDAWLALDRNQNGVIDNGAELFGDFTAQPPASNKNGFLALAEFDKEANGGNHDGIVDNRDSIFSKLRLWQDVNHNGVADNGELHRLNELNVLAFELDFKESKRVDEAGNEFRYRGKIRDAKQASVARWAWDVFLVTNQ